MRKTLLGLMLAATAALPTMASAQIPQQREGRGQWRGNGEGRPQQQARQWGGEQRGGDGNRWQRPQGAQPAATPAVPSAPQQQPVGRDGGQRFDGRGGDRQFSGRQGGERPAEHRFNSTDRRFDGGDRRRYALGAGAQWARGYADRRDDARDLARFADRAQWNRGWRGNDRYDYGGFRSANRGAFHLPRYYAPRGWNYGYRRFSVGLRLSPLLFGESYWIGEPFDYRLPTAYGPYRWVRYYNDALLVDIDTGEVVDTVYDIFW